MRAVGSEMPGDGNIIDDPHLETMGRFLTRIAGGAESVHARSVTMILRSAAAQPARVLVRKRRDLAKAGVLARVILAKLEPEEELRELFACLCELAPDTQATDLIRWARNPRLLDAHEQVTYGDSMSWSGDAMRRDASRRNVMTVFEDEAPQAARLGQLGFRALWAASSRVTERRLRGQAATRPAGTYQLTNEAAAGVSAIKPGFQGWPLIRH